MLTHNPFIVVNGTKHLYTCILFFVSVLTEYSFSIRKGNFI